MYYQNDFFSDPILVFSLLSRYLIRYIYIYKYKIDNLCVLVAPIVGTSIKSGQTTVCVWCEVTFICMVLGEAYCP